MKTIARRAFALALALAPTPIVLGAASAALRPANTLHDLFANLQACMATTAGPPGSQLTVRFSIRSDGALIGAPRITFTRLVGDGEARRRFLLGALRAFEACLPLPVTAAMGQAIAGHPIAVRIIVKQPAAPTI